jgi:opacity protein-like surface antigen
MGVLFNAGHTAVTGEVEAELGKYKSIYYRPEMVNDEAKLYGLLGYTQLDVTVANKDTAGKELSSATTSYSGFSYGVGIGFVFADRFNINFEYKNICRDLYDKANAATISLDYRF